jgi:hypothetical protein
MKIKIKKIKSNSHTTCNIKYIENNCHIKYSCSIDQIFRERFPFSNLKWNKSLKIKVLYIFVET